jgi:outer membrane protein assembly factor BamB
MKALFVASPLLSALTRCFPRPHRPRGKTRTGRRKPPRTRLLLEALEDRTVPTAVALPANAVSWWTANSTANDALGLNNATLSNVTYATGEVGKAFSFNGSNGWAALGDPSSLAFTNSMTIEGWVKVNGLPTNYNFGSIMFRGDDRGGLDPYQLDIQPNGELNFGIDNASNEGTGIQAPIATGQWVHVAATLDDGTGLMTLYENGAVVAQTTTTIRPFATLDPTQEPGVGIGNSNALDNYNVPFNGLIDELTVYNRALTSGEVLGIYKAGSSGKVQSPVAVSNPSVVNGSGPATFTLTRTNTSGSLTVNWTTADDTAKAGTNYVAASGTVTFADGQATQTVTVTTLNDATPEPNVDFELIATPSGGTSVMGVATIVTNTTNISVADASASEGSSHFVSLGALVDQAGNGGLDRSTGMAFGPDGNLYVGSLNSNQVLRYDATTGAFLGAFVTSGSGGLTTPAVEGLIFRPDGKLYVASRDNATVLRYDAVTGAFLDAFVPANSGGLSGIKGMVFGPDGNLYISSADTNQVLRYDGTTGAFLGVFVAAGSGGLSGPRDLTFGPDGNLYASSSTTNAVLRYDGTTGAFLNTFIAANAGGLTAPAGILFANGSVYMASQGTNQVLRYDAATGAFIEAAVAANSGGLDRPLDLLLDTNNNLLVGSYAGILRYGPASQAAFTVSLAWANTVTTTVSYATADGTALAGTHYTATSGTLTFAPGETAKTVLVPTLDDGLADPTRAFTLNLSNPVGGAITRGQAVGTILDDTKFYVVDGGSSDSTYQYASTGAALGSNGLGSGDTAPRGVADTAAGTTEWVVDANKTVYVYSTGGALLGSWSAGGLSSSATLTGIATNGTDIWLVDSNSHKVYDYAGAASRLSGSQSAASSFSLNKSDSNPQDIVTDGTSLWVVDGSALKVFKYTLSGSLLGSWSIDRANTHPTGITINPSNVSDIWIVDNGTEKVYQYTGAASRTSGSQSAAATFALAPGDTNPQGIADPPPAGLLLTPAAPPPAIAEPSVPGSIVTASLGNSVPANVPTLAGRDAVFASLGRESVQRPGEPSIALLGGQTVTPWLDSPTFTTDRGTTPGGIFGRQNLLTADNSQGSGSTGNAAALACSPVADEKSPESPTAADSYFAVLAEDALAEE